MIRATAPEDTETLLAITAGTGVFRPTDVATLREVLDEYHAESHAEGHRCVTDERDGQIIGFAYYAPAAMTDRTWFLWWIVVRQDTQARGVGTDLLRYVEDAARRERGRLMMIETSSTDAYERTRRFYLKHGYEQEALLRDYYTAGDGMVFFRKQLGD